MNHKTQSTTSDHGLSGGHTYNKYLPLESDNTERIGTVFLVRSVIKKNILGTEIPYLHWALGIQFLDEQNFWVLLEGNLH